MRGEYVDELFDVSISDDGIVSFIGSGRCICMPARIFRQQHARNAEALAKYQFSRLPRPIAVIPLGKRD